MNGIYFAMLNFILINFEVSAESPKYNQFIAIDEDTIFN